MKESFAEKVKDAERRAAEQAQTKKPRPTQPDQRKRDERHH